MAELTQATILDVTGRYQIAQIGLNGYKSHTSNPLEDSGQKRTIWSFTVVDGDHENLYSAWWDRSAIMLRLQGQDVPVRVAALPVDAASFGLIEFI
ncbi:MAG TPA: hypothetical protein ENJ56_08935 [Anaerolineae bacterium]|nr:hypothetical protein [Anaerolineae bacterium]